jgi:hypothetical protein
MLHSRVGPLPYPQTDLERLARDKHSLENPSITAVKGLIVKAPKWQHGYQIFFCNFYFVKNNKIANNSTAAVG